MTKKIFATIASSVAAFSMMAAPQIDIVDPPYWWSGMENDTLQIMLHGDDIRDCHVNVDYPGVELLDIARLDNPNYQFLYLLVTEEAQPGTINITLNDLKLRRNNQAVIPYKLRQRDANARDIKGFDASDVLYLIMPDRFADGNPDNNRNINLKNDVKADRSNPNGRHGGDIKGITDHLDYIENLGVTAIWVNPVLTNDMPGGTYHGYATTDYYNIDPRFGTNQEWNNLVEQCHKRGIKVVMDMIFNHSGSEHIWFTDRPSRDWFNFPEGYQQTSYRLSTVYDPYVSNYDRRLTTDGWFVESMPDLNQNNPHLMTYLIQNSIWWIESSKIDGIRMDTHPYAFAQPMAQWIDAVEREYPNYNIVGECWYGTEGGEAYWQRGSKVSDINTNLPTVMDFVLSISARKAFSEQTDPWNGLNTIYDHLALDYLFPNPQKILTFLDNHDTDRFLLEEPEDLGWWKQALTFLLTSRGIPQLYYGTELLMHGKKEGSDGYVRLDFPGGFPGDAVNAFTPEGRTPMQNEAHDFLAKVLNWRKGKANDVIANGTLKHFMPTNGIYLYERRLGDKQVIVMLNGNDNELLVEMDRYNEILPIGTTMHDMLTNTPVTIGEEMTFAPRAIYILENF
ncbi:MAG: glycoside hydrolase family 13 protein [Muribaculaceae bacterium]|nr:glycoside hydrolase family 13 protein [Muribaculaceae bacterium]